MFKMFKRGRNGNLISSVPDDDKEKKHDKQESARIVARMCISTASECYVRYLSVALCPDPPLVVCAPVPPPAVPACAAPRRGAHALAARTGPGPHLGLGWPLSVVNLLHCAQLLPCRGAWLSDMEERVEKRVSSTVSWSDLGQ